MNNEDTLQLIYQYMHEQGYEKALATLQEDSGVKEDRGLFDKNRRLRHILNEHREFQQALLGPDPSSLDEMTVDQALKIQQHQPIASASLLSLNGAHGGGLVTIRCSSFPGTPEPRTFLATAATTREIKIWDVSGVSEDPPRAPECLGTIPSSSTCLTIEFHPRIP